MANTLRVRLTPGAGRRILRDDLILQIVYEFSHWTNCSLKQLIETKNKDELGFCSMSRDDRLIKIDGDLIRGVYARKDNSS